MSTACAILITAALVRIAVGYTTHNTGRGTVYRLKVTEDVTLEDGSSNSNNLQYLLVAYHPQFPKKRFLVKFEDLPKSCSRDSIKWAKMYLYFVYAHKASSHTPQLTPDIDRPLTVHMVKKDWTESQATTTYRLDYGWHRFTWGTPYLGLDDVDAQSQYQDRVTMYAQRPRGFKEFDVTTAVKQWREGTSNYGLLVRATNEATPGRDLRFYSNAYSDATKHAYVNVLCSKKKVQTVAAPTAKYWGTFLLGENP